MEYEQLAKKRKEEEKAITDDPTEQTAETMIQHMLSNV
jgi:hypothetical protein